MNLKPRLSVRVRLTITYGVLFLAAGVALLAVSYVLVDEALERRPDGIRVFGVRQQRRLAGHLRKRRAIRCHHRQTGRHRLEHRQTEALVEGRKRQNRGREQRYRLDRVTPVRDVDGVSRRSDRRSRCGRAWHRCLHTSSLNSRR